MRKLLLVFALFAIGAGCSSPVVVEEADPNIANEEWECPDPPEASPNPNTMAYELWLMCNPEGEG